MEKEEVAGHRRLAKGRQASGRRLRGRGAGSTAEVIQGEGEARLRAASLAPACLSATARPPPLGFSQDRGVEPHSDASMLPGRARASTTAGARQASQTSQVERDDAEKSAREKSIQGHLIRCFCSSSCSQVRCHVLLHCSVLFWGWGYGFDRKVGNCEDGLPAGDNRVPLF